MSFTSGFLCCDLRAPNPHQPCDPPTFSKFLELPCELQNIIWEELFPGPRIVEIYHRQYSLRFKGASPPIILQVCRHSREMALSRYTAFKSITTGTSIYVDLALDTVYLNNVDDILYTAKTFPSLMTTVKSLAIEFGVQGSAIKQLCDPALLPLLNSLRTLQVVIGWKPMHDLRNGEPIKFCEVQDDSITFRSFEGPRTYKALDTEVRRRIDTLGSSSPAVQLVTISFDLA